MTVSKNVWFKWRLWTHFTSRNEPQLDFTGTAQRPIIQVVVRVGNDLAKGLEAAPALERLRDSA